MMIQCSPAAYAKCPTRALCGRREDATFTEGSECDLFNRSVEDQPMTNADRIRAMNDRQQAQLFVKAVGDGCPPAHEWDCRKDEEGWDACDACWERWLQQPAEVDLK